GCGSSAKTSSPAPAPATRAAPGNARRLSVVAHAAAKTAQARGAHIVLTGTVTGPKGTVAIHGSGDFALDQQRGKLTLTTGDGGTKCTEIFDSYVLYMTFAGVTGATGGKTWMKLDLGKFLKEIGGNASQLTSSNPTQALEQLEAAGTVREIGR